jgi:hypothetical protein
MIEINIAKLESELSEIEKNSCYAAGSYASLLRVILMPSVYKVDDNTAVQILSSLRKNEINSSAVRVLRLLNELVPPNQ